jgi:hypothetical protein
MKWILCYTAPNAPAWKSPRYQATPSGQKLFEIRTLFGQHISV